MAQETPPRSARPPAPAAGGTAVLSRALSDFLMTFSITLNKHVIYPPGHPLLVSAVDDFAQRLTHLLHERPAVAIGIARHQLIIEGVATDPHHPVLHELAERLHRNQLGALKFLAGIQRDELADILASIASEAGPGGRPLGLDVERLAATWEHVRFFPLTYDRLELVNDPEGQDADAQRRPRSARAAQLWIGLARAALAAEAAQSDQGDVEPMVVARAIEDHHREQAYDQVVVGYLLQIADELKTSDDPESIALQKRISHMVESLQPSTLGRLLEMGGDVEQRRHFLLTATQTLSVQAVIDLASAAASVSSDSISHAMMRMLAKLARYSEDGPELRRANADQALRGMVQRLVDGWTLDGTNPEEYRAALEAGALAGSADIDSPAMHECEPERLVQTALELGALGPQVWRAIELLLPPTRVGVLLEILDAAPEGDPVDEVWAFVVKRGVLRSLLAETRVDVALVGRIVRRVGVAAAPTVLDALERIEDPKVRQRLFEILLALGGEVVPLLCERVPSASTLLQRELLGVIGRLEEIPGGFDARPYGSHPDAAVRREATRLLLRDPAARDAALVTALADPDERVVSVALAAALERCPREGIAIVRRRVDDGDFGARLCATAVRVAATGRTPETLDWLALRVLTRSRILRRPKLLPPTPEVLAAIAVIAEHWSRDPAAATILRLATASKIPDVRQAAEPGRRGPSRTESAAHE